MPSCWWWLITHLHRRLSACVYLLYWQRQFFVQHRNTETPFVFLASKPFRTPGEVFRWNRHFVPRYTSPKSKFWKGVHECDCPVGLDSAWYKLWKERSEMGVLINTTSNCQMSPCVGFFGEINIYACYLFFCWKQFFLWSFNRAKLKVGTLSAHVGGRPFWWVRFRDAVSCESGSIHLRNQPNRVSFKGPPSN